MNNIYLIKDGLNAGPYSRTEVVERINDGRYTKSDLAWYEGCNELVPIVDVLVRRPTGEPVSATTLTKEPFSAKELRQIADNYHGMLILVVVFAVICFIPMEAAIERSVMLPLCGLWIGFGWRLSGALRRKRWLWVVWSMIPIACLYALIRLLYTAAKTLNNHGIPCNLLGANRAALQKLEKSQAK